MHDEKYVPSYVVGTGTLGLRTGMIVHVPRHGYSFPIAARHIGNQQRMR